MRKLREINFSRAERRSLVAKSDNLSRRDVARADHVSMNAAKMRIYRARRRAKRHGVIIPVPRQTYIVERLAVERLAAA